MKNAHFVVNPTIFTVAVPCSKPKTTILILVRNLLFQLFRLRVCSQFRIVVLTSDRIVNFRLLGDDSGESDDKPITRHLKTSNWTVDLPSRRLEQPNLVQGVSAAGKVNKN